MIILTRKEYDRRIKKAVNKAVEEARREDSLFHQFERIQQQLFEMDQRIEKLQVRFEPLHGCTCEKTTTVDCQQG